jgi:type VI secretion system secreted protein VgrG
MSPTRKITLHSPIAPEKLLIRRALIAEQLGQPFSIEMELISPDEALDFDAILGREMRIEVALDDGGTRYFHAYFVEFAQTGRMGTYATYRARCAPWLWFLTRTADCRIFQDQSVPEIVKSVFREHGFTDFKDRLTRSYRKREYCVQYRETDFDFVQRLMEEEGIYYYFAHTQNSHSLVLADSYSGHESVSGYETIEYFPPSENEVREKDHIFDWRQSRNIQSGKYVLTDYDFTKPRAKLETQYVQKRSFPNSSYEVFDYPGKYTAVADGDVYVRARLEALQQQSERFEGAGVARGQAVGYLFKLAGYPRKDQNKEYLVIAATYELDAGEYESHGQAGDRDFLCHFQAINAKVPFRAPLLTPKPHVGGPQTATVVGPEGEEIHTDKYGRVKVKFHWDRAPERNENSSCWVRVSQIWAGKNWGWMTIPRIGQEVVVDFLEGDPDQPLITGRVYNQDNMPPYDLPANKTQSGIKTRSSMNGGPENFNEIRFEDKKGAEQLFIHAEKNQVIEVENDETHWVGHNRTKTIDNDEVTHVKHDRQETVDNNEQITIGGNRSEAVGKDETINVGGSRTEAVGNSESISVAKNRTTDIGESDSLAVGKNREHTIGNNETITIGANRSESIGKKHTLEVGESQEITVGKDQRIQVGKKFYLEAGDEIVLKTGSASITLKKDGTIQLKGKDITISGSGKIGVKASSDVTIKGSKVNQN